MVFASNLIHSRHLTLFLKEASLVILMSDFSLGHILRNAFRCFLFHLFAIFTAHRWLSWLSTGLLVFSDKDDKPEVRSHNPSMFIILWDVNEPAQLS